VPLITAGLNWNIWIKALFLDCSVQKKAER